MWPNCLLLVVLVLLSTTTTTTTTAQEAVPFFVNCGAASTIQVDGRRWSGDAEAIANLTLTSPGSSVIESDKKFDSPLHTTARIFNASSNYTFQVLPGNYYLRLHFCPFPFPMLRLQDSIFDVTANNLTLLSNYNVSDQILSKNAYLHDLGTNSTVASLLKEYFLNITTTHLFIQLRPLSSSFAFVNAIEIVPVLDDAFFDTVVDRGMETMFRLNVGGPQLQPTDDHHLWRKWDSDDIYMYAPNAARIVSNTSNITYSTNANFSSAAAPLLLYTKARIMSNNDVVDKKFNMSWKFDVDPNFNYLVRFHFCELLCDGPSQRIFRIYINFRMAAENYDIFVRAGGKNKAYHDDYVDLISDQTNILWVQLGPDSSTSASGTDALLNGLEIFKLSRNGNLAHVSEKMNMEEEKSLRKNSRHVNIWVATGIGVASLLMVSGLCAVFSIYIYRRKNRSVKRNPPGWRPLTLHSVLGSTTNARAVKLPIDTNGSVSGNRNCRNFSLIEIRVATNNFDESLVIGTGGFGKVYKGEIEDGTVVAIKRAHPKSGQGLAEFETEIEMLSKLRHKHLVSMIGYCDEQNEMILVYEYMANGTLRSHLFGSDLPALSWKQRLDACIGAARGLHYLHTGAERGIIHRDVKTTNILLDDKFVAKMADFGLSKTGPALDHTHVSTAVKGSFGYLDPEYFRRQQLTQKSDVYSFGVVLFEVICARPVIDPTLPKDQINLAEWAVRWQRQRSLETIVDPILEGDYSLESLKKFGEIAEKCLSDEGKNRPTMGEVLWYLEYVMQLHEAYLSSEDGCPSAVSDERLASIAPSLRLINEGEEDECNQPASLKVSSILAGAIEDQCFEDVIEAEQSSNLCTRPPAETFWGVVDG